METLERPAKIRKLSHGGGATADDQSVAVAGSKPSAISHNDKPRAESNNNSEPPNLAANNTAVAGDEAKEGLYLPQDPKDNADITQPTEPLSKNQLKKLRKQQEWDAGREWRKAKHKEKDAQKKARKRELKKKIREERIAQGLDPVQEIPRWKRSIRLPVTFLIDCGFDDKMMEKERTSLGSQITRSYSDNHKAPYQAHLMISSWGGLLKERFDTTLDKNYVKWRGVEFTDKSFVAAAEVAKSIMAGERGGKLAGIFSKYIEQTEGNTESELAGVSNDQQQTSRPKVEQPAIEASNPIETPGDDGTNKAPKSDTAEDPALQLQIEKLKEQGEIVYLTSDSPNTLSELKPYSTYIIGGLVDKNRHKGICYKAACDRGIKTAKLPIGQYMEMQSRFVLATNHVVELMVKWLECGDWAESFMTAIPKRKGGKLKNGQNSGGTPVDNDEQDGDDQVDDRDESPFEDDEVNIGDSP